MVTTFSMRVRLCLPLRFFFFFFDLVRVFFFFFFFFSRFRSLRFLRAISSSPAVVRPCVPCEQVDKCRLRRACCVALPLHSLCTP